MTLRFSRRFAIIWSTLSHVDVTFTLTTEASSEELSKHVNTWRIGALFKSIFPVKRRGVESQRMTLTQSRERDREGGGGQKTNILLRIHAIARDPRWILTSALDANQFSNSRNNYYYISRAPEHGKRGAASSAFTPLLLVPKINLFVFRGDTVIPRQRTPGWNAFRGGFEPPACLAGGVEIYANGRSALHFASYFVNDERETSVTLRLAAAVKIGWENWVSRGSISPPNRIKGIREP